jgi:aspartate/methionine/tyrosine aminotransferase
MALFSDRNSLLDTENAFKVGPYIKEVEAGGMKVVKCNLGEPDFALPVHIRDEIKRQLDLDNTHYNDPAGVLPLRETVAAQISKTRGIEMTPEREVLTLPASSSRCCPQCCHTSTRQVWDEGFSAPVVGLHARICTVLAADT